MDDADLIRETIERFPGLDPAALIFDPIVRGGSERSFLSPERRQGLGSHPDPVRAR